MSNSVDPDEPSHLDLRYLQTPIIIVYGSERVNVSLSSRKEKNLREQVRNNLSFREDFFSEGKQNNL